MNPFKQMNAKSTLALLVAVLLFGCKREKEELKPEKPADYLPLQSGKYITYRIDSTIFTDFGANTVVRTYQEKHVIDAQVTDNLGRPSYRVFRSQRDSAGIRAWKPSGSYLITVADQTAEMVENNLRFLILATPVKESTVWRGNQFLPDDAYAAFDFSNDDGMADWEFAYTGTGKTAIVNGKTFTNVATVQQIDESTNAPVTNAALYGFRNFVTAKYAKGLGLIYEERIMWEYQAPSAPRPGFRGFEVRRSILDYN